jgi:anti-sigma factor RsiW
MSNDPLKVGENELHAYADGLLAQQDIARVDQWLARNPDDAARIREWQQQNIEIKQMFAGYERSLPDDRKHVAFKAAPPFLSRQRSWQAAAAAIVIFAAGGLSGLVVPQLFGNGPQMTTLSQEASSAFLIYASDVRHPVEVPASDKDHLVAWLGKRLGHKIAAPDLTMVGYSLVGGRLVPVGGQAGALLMYEDASGKRLTILLGHAADDRETAFRFAKDGSVETLYWIDNALSYAVSGEVSRDTLTRVATECYQQFQT